MFDYLPPNLDFDVHFEPTKMDDKKYVINASNDEYIGIVGDGFTCSSHPDFFRDVINATTEKLSEKDMQGATVNWRSAHKNGWAMMDMTLPNVNEKIITDKHETTVAQRIIALHGVNGTCSNVTIFGAIDFFCLNGQIRGRHDKVVHKNTSNFSLDLFIQALEQAQDDFTAQTQQMQRWANTSLMHVDVKARLEGIMGSDSKAEKMNILYNQEVATRGRNLWSLYSAFTNYATYADERNNFKLRNTGNDTQAISMFKREMEVEKWVDSTMFSSLVAA